MNLHELNKILTDHSKFLFDMAEDDGMMGDWGNYEQSLAHSISIEIMNSELKLYGCDLVEISSKLSFRAFNNTIWIDKHEKYKASVYLKLLRDVLLSIQLNNRVKIRELTDMDKDIEIFMKHTKDGSNISIWNDILRKC